MGLDLNLLLIDFGSQCNNHCMFCATHLYPRVTIRMQDFKDFDDLISCATAIDITSYGEITIHPDFLEIVERLTAAGKPFDFTTNGIEFDKWLDMLGTSTLRNTSISMNSLVPETYAYLCGTGSCEKVKANIDLILSKPRTFALGLHYAVNTMIWPEIPAIIEFSAVRKLRVTNMNDLVPNLTYPEGFKVPDTPENRQQLKVWKKYVAEIGVPIHFFSFRDRAVNPESEADRSARLKICTAPWHIASIDKTGNVFPCCYSHESMGNIREHTLGEVWEGPIYVDLRECLTRGDAKYCQMCADSNHTLGED